LRYGQNFGLYFRFWDKVMGTDAMPPADVPNRKPSA
jgi:sterol desaturase/sphingolipid hydroxylase (fatty acid hydroxylase superfamily)